MSSTDTQKFHGQGVTPFLAEIESLSESNGDVACIAARLRSERLEEADVPKDPLELFNIWLAQATECQV